MCVGKEKKKGAGEVREMKRREEGMGKRVCLHLL